jgi:glycine betaine transporter
MWCCFVIALVFLIFPLQTIEVTSQAIQHVIQKLGLSYIIASSILVILSLTIALSSYGRIRLGASNEEPEFGLLTWLAMLFAAGMGSGLVFWGVAEPIFHFANPPPFAANAENPKDMALALTYFHWGIHAWSLYAIAGLAIAWFAFKRGRPLRISSCFGYDRKPFIHSVIDFVAVISIVFGVAGTLANSIILIQTGFLQSSYWFFEGFNFRFLLLIFIASIFTTSSILGLHKGIKQLSQLNLWLSLMLLLTVMFMVNPIAVFEKVVSSTLLYIQKLPSLSFAINKDSQPWSEGWSVIYLIWWIAWTPFIGPFIAKISRGRTIRQFLLCVIFIPTLTSIIWFSTFSGGLFEMLALPKVVAAVNENYTYGLFAFFDELPLSIMLSCTAILLLIIFVVTSVDSAIYVTAMLTDQSSRQGKLLWSFIFVCISTALLYKNNVDLNKQIAIIGAVPFTLILLFQVIFLLVDMGKNKFKT